MIAISIWKYLHTLYFRVWQITAHRQSTTCFGNKVYWNPAWLICSCITCAAFLCFPSRSAGKESAHSAGDPGSIPGSGRCSGEGIGYPVQCSWASLGAQLVKNPPAVQKTWVRSLGWEGKGYPLQYSCLENYMDSLVHGVAKSWTQLSNFHFLSVLLLYYKGS